MRKKIMLIVPMLHQGGFERICVMTARLLSDYADVTVVVFSKEDLAFDISGLSVVDLGLKAKEGRLGKVLNVLKRGRALTRLQKRLKTDISYSFGMTANIANAVSFGAGKKIAACHSFEEIWKKGYMQLISRFCDTVLCCSKKMADIVEKTYRFQNIVPLWNPCDIEGIQTQCGKTEEDLSFFRTSDRVLVSMGREDDVKGFWHLLKVFRKIVEEMPDTRLAIIGDGEFTEYKELTKKLDVEEKVWFAGLKKNPFPYLKESQAYLLTSLSEGLPNALVEALALSIPIVSVNCKSGPAEILHTDWQTAENEKAIFLADFGILTPELSSEKNMEVSIRDGKICLEEAEEQLAEAVRFLLRHPDIYEKYKEAGPIRAQAFSEESYLKGLIKCIE